MYDKFNKYRSNEGYINLDSISKKVLDRKTYGSRKGKVWFSIFGDKYLFKPSLNKYEEYKEVINYLIAENLDISTATYDLASLNGIKGVITKDFIKNSSFAPMLLLLCKNNSCNNCLYNYYMAMKNDNIDPNIIKSNMHSFYFEHLLDIFTCQYDRNVENNALMDGVKAPRFDSAASFLSLLKPQKINNFMALPDKKLYIEKFKGKRTKLRVMPGSMKENSIDELLKAIYEYQDIDKDFREIFYSTDSYISKIKTVDFTNIMNLLKEYYEVMPQSYYDFFRFIVEYKLEEYERKLTRYH